MNLFLKTTLLAQDLQLIKSGLFKTKKGKVTVELSKQPKLGLPSSISLQNPLPLTDTTLPVVFRKIFKSKNRKVNCQPVYPS